MSIEDAIPGVAQGKLILAGIALAGIAIPTIGWTITAHTLKGARQTIALDKANMAAESNAHQVTIQSLGQCMTNNDALNAQSEARAKAYTDSQAASDAAAKDAEKAREALKVYQSRMQGMADKAETLGKCPMSDDLRAEMEKFYAKP